MKNEPSLMGNTEFPSSPADFSSGIRSRVFATQGQAADYFNIARTTISRYESDRLTPPIGYLAELVHLLYDQEVTSDKVDDEGAAEYRKRLVLALNKLLDTSRATYPGTPLFSNWDHLVAVGKQFVSERTGRLSRGGDTDRGISQSEQPEQHAPETTLLSQPTTVDPQSSARPPLVMSIHLQAVPLILVALILGVVIGASVQGTLTRIPSQPPTPVAQQSSVTMLTPSATPAVSICGEQDKVKAENGGEFLRHQGVSSFRIESTRGAVLSNKVRSLAIDQRGIWIGYFATEKTPNSGLGIYNRETWSKCAMASGQSGNNINALAIDSKDRVWATIEQGGVLMFDGTAWHVYTTDNGLPSNETFDLTIDKNDNIWVATWEGVAKYDGREWTVPYAAEIDGPLFRDHVQAIAIDSRGHIWLGHPGSGVSESTDFNGWVHHSPSSTGIGGDAVFDILVRNAEGTSSESIWFATNNGVSKYEEGLWVTYRTGDGLPSNSVRTLAIDMYNRVWAATSGGVAYLDERTWVTYNTIPTLSIAFGPECAHCPFNADHVWTGTETLGLTHSRLPLLAEVPVIDVLPVRYRKVEAVSEPFRDEIVVAPGESFLAEIEISPRAPYSLTNTRGDLLSNLEVTEEQRYGAYVHMPVKETIQPGEHYVFTDYDNPFLAPQLPDGVQEQKYTTRYRVWMYTRYVGPVIEVTFTVQRP